MISSDEVDLPGTFPFMEHQDYQLHSELSLMPAPCWEDLTVGALSDLDLGESDNPIEDCTIPDDNAYLSFPTFEANKDSINDFDDDWDLEHSIIEDLSHNLLCLLDDEPEPVSQWDRCNSEWTSNGSQSDTPEVLSSQLDLGSAHSLLDTSL
jgi:hypothetical protein